MPKGGKGGSLGTGQAEETASAKVLEWELAKCLRNSQEAREAGAGGGRGEEVEAARQTEKIMVKKSRKGALSFGPQLKEGGGEGASWTQSRRI